MVRWCNDAICFGSNGNDGEVGYRWWCKVWWLDGGGGGGENNQMNVYITCCKIVK